MSKKKMYLIVLLVSTILISGCMQEKFTKKDILEKTIVQGQGIIKVKSKSGKRIKIKAVPNKNWQFVQWKGSLSGNKPLQNVVAEEEMNIIAKFEYVGPDIEGTGTKKDPFVIYTLAGLEKIGDGDYPLDGYYKLGKDIDATPTQAKDYNDGQGWNSIGWAKEFHGNQYIYREFKGVFDGNGYKIKNLYIKKETGIGFGLFSIIRKGTVKNTNLVNVNIKGNRIVGGLVGINKGKIKNCYVTGQIKGTDYIAGLVGSNEGEVKDSYADSNVIGKKRYIGGLVGYNAKNVGKIKRCYAVGNTEGFKIVGGLTGANNGKVEVSYASGNVKGTEYIGGLVGINRKKGEIKSVYASGDVEGEQIVGGLVSYNLGKIENAYTVSEVKGNKYVGGLVDYNKESGEIRNSYWSKEISKQNRSCGGTSKTKKELKQKETFKNWDFDNVWRMNDSYPYLFKNCKKSK